MTDARRRMGAAGEDAALKHLRRAGLRLIDRNVRLGRTGELDLIMDDRGYLVFVEVKAMLAGENITGFQKVHAHKQHKLLELGAMYLARHPGPYKGVRMDAVEVAFSDATLRRSTVTHIRDAFRG
jgi:putative endonuclease